VVTLHHTPVHDLVEQACRPGQQQLPQRDDTHQPPVLVGQVEIEDHLDVFAAADVVDRLLDVRLCGSEKNIGGHDAAGTVRVVLQQAFDFVLAVAAEQGHQLRYADLRADRR
jgi:hypothetical protein